MTRVLIVEDDDDIAAGLCDILIAAGYEAGRARDGLDGLDQLHGLKGMRRPDLVFLDLMMPVFTGWDFLNAKNSDREVCEIPVVVLTACSVHEARAVELPGVLLIIHKPFDIDRLLSVVECATYKKCTSAG